MPKFKLPSGHTVLVDRRDAHILKYSDTLWGAHEAKGMQYECKKWYARFDSPTGFRSSAYFKKPEQAAREYDRFVFEAYGLERALRRANFPELLRKKHTA